MAAMHEQLLLLLLLLRLWPRRRLLLRLLSLLLRLLSPNVALRRPSPLLRLQLRLGWRHSASGYPSHELRDCDGLRLPVRQ